MLSSEAVDDVMNKKAKNIFLIAILGNYRLFYSITKLLLSSKLMPIAHSP
jgi:hypothetical protein